mmetsp:Transcript_120438/g.340759  ORF Transcript_120438/g.340759 Transcript_120438/m.340759 type:complete len:131 (-) Transcript_120438:59-451(-)
MAAEDHGRDGRARPRLWDSRDGEAMAVDVVAAVEPVDATMEAKEALEPMTAVPSNARFYLDPIVCYRNAHGDVLPSCAAGVAAMLVAIVRAAGSWPKQATLAALRAPSAKAAFRRRAAADCVRHGRHPTD